MRRKAVYSGKLIKLFETLRKLPDGREGYFEEVRHPGAAIVVPFYKGKIVFIRQYRGVIGKYLWELPAGKLSAGEPPAACARREVKEETGYVVGRMRKLGAIYTTPGFCDEKIHVYLAGCKARTAAKRDWDEFITVKLMTRKEAVRLFKSGKINDAKTIAAMAFSGILRG